MYRIHVPKYPLSIAAVALLVMAQVMAVRAGQAVPMQRDNNGRPTAKVTINETAEFVFAVDTGAQMTALGRSVIDRLGLSPVPGQNARAHGSGGTALLDMYAIKSLVFAGIRKENLTLPMPAHRPHDMGHDGILGADIFGDERIEFDFEGGVIRAGAHDSTTRVQSLPATLLFGTFATIEVQIDRVKATAVIDTGAKDSFGNAALMAALRLSADDRGLSRLSEPTGVTGHEKERIVGFSGALTIGTRTFGDTSIAFMSSPVFQSLGLTDKPALILGIDVLGRFASFAIDYRDSAFEYR